MRPFARRWRYHRLSVDGIVLLLKMPFAIATERCCRRHVVRLFF